MKNHGFFFLQNRPTRTSTHSTSYICIPILQYDTKTIQQMCLNLPTPVLLARVVNKE